MFEAVFSQIENALPGLRAISVVGDDGIEIDSYVKSDLAHEVISAEMTGILRTLDRAKSELSLGRLDEVVIRTDEENILLLSLNAGLFVLLVTDPTEATGRARYEVKRLAHQIIEILQ
jgi:predicted regulator of Ras-like GTPase activity (Roadblock/LC7/MglB family)